MLQRGKRWMVGVAAVAALAAGCMPPSRTEFIERLATENRRIARSAWAFRSAFLPLATGQSVDKSAVHSAYDDLAKTIKDVKGDMAGQMLPPSSNSAKDFLAGYKDYLDTEQAILDGPLKQIVAAIDAGTDWDTVKGMMNDAGAQDDAAFNKLSKAQQDYCSEHNYQSESLDQYISDQKAGK